MIACTVGIMAYNEAANIGGLIEALLGDDSQQVDIRQIVVVSSGSTDATEAIVRAFAQRDSRVQLITQERREGKASAVNLLLRHVDDEIIVLQSADTLPGAGAIAVLLAPLCDRQVGMVGGRPVPLNRSSSFLGFGVNLLWELHHQVCLRRPKMGELIAFRNTFHQIPKDTAVDEASIEPLILAQGLRIQYAPGAVVYNCGPDNLAEYICQRRRIFAGHLHVKATQRYQVATMNGLLVFWLYLKTMKFTDWRYWVWGTGIVLLEVLCRLLGWMDYKVLRRNPFNWPMAKSTKRLANG